MIVTQPKSKIFTVFLYSNVCRCSILHVVPWGARNFLVWLALFLLWGRLAGRANKLGTRSSFMLLSTAVGAYGFA